MMNAQEELKACLVQDRSGARQLNVEIVNLLKRKMDSEVHPNADKMEVITEQQVEGAFLYQADRPILAAFPSWVTRNRNEEGRMVQGGQRGWAVNVR